MRTRMSKVAVGLAAGLSALVGVGGCAGDDQTVGEQLRDAPTVEGCQDAMRTFLDRLLVPPGYDPADGTLEIERSLALSAIDAAAEGLFNPTTGGHPCMGVLAELPPEEAVEFLGSLDQEALAFLGAVTGFQFGALIEG